MHKRIVIIPTLLLLSNISWAEQGGTVLDEISVVERKNDELAGSSIGYYQKISDTVVKKERLQKQSATLGNALAGELGVHSNPFGGGASAPIIRGQEGIRIKILQNGLDVVDMSTISPDHAIAADSLLAHQIELVRGASTLRYSTSSPAGVVNVVDKRIPTAIPEKGYEGEFNTRFDTASKEKVATLGVTTKLTNNFALRVEALKRDSKNYKVPQFNAGQIIDYVPDTYNKSTVGTIGLSWIGDKGYLGMSYSHRKDKYGLPGHNHKFDNCKGHLLDTGENSVIRRTYLVPYPHLADDSDVIDYPHFDGCTSDHSSDPEHSHDNPYGQDHVHDPSEIGPWVELLSRRFDLRGELKKPFAAVDKVSLSFSYADYIHHEKDSGKAGISAYDTDYMREITIKQALAKAGKAAGIFKNRGYNAKLEVEHAPIGNLTGLWGVQYSEYKTSIRSTYNQGIALRYPLIPNTNKILSLFALENYVLGDFIFEVGARLDKQRIPIKYDQSLLEIYVKPNDQQPDLSTYKQNAFSYSGSVEWLFHPNYRLSAIVSRNERLPTPMELYYNGKHLATNSFEYGNKNLKKEKSNNFELSFAYDGSYVDYRISGYYNRFKNYIYNEDLFKSGNLFMRRYTQAEARIYGLEGEITFKPTEDYNITLFGDYVNGKLFNLPRKYTRKLYDYHVGYDEEGLMTRIDKLKGEMVIENPERNAPRMPPSRLGMRFTGQFTDHFSGFIEYTYVFSQRKTAKSLSVRDARGFTADDFEEGELLEGVDINKYNPEGIDLSNEDDLNEFKEWVENIRLYEKNQDLAVIKKDINESATDGHHLLNLGVNYQRKWGNIDYKISLTANNILNQKVYTHTSFLPYVPQMGRNYVLGIGIDF